MPDDAQQNRDAVFDGRLAYVNDYGQYEPAPVTVELFTVSGRRIASATSTRPGLVAEVIADGLEFLIQSGENFSDPAQLRFYAGPSVPAVSINYHGRPLEAASVFEHMLLEAKRISDSMRRGTEA